MSPTGFVPFLKHFLPTEIPLPSEILLKDVYEPNENNNINDKSVQIYKDSLLSASPKRVRARNHALSLFLKTILPTQNCPMGIIFSTELLETLRKNFAVSLFSYLKLLRPLLIAEWQET